MLNLAVYIINIELSKLKLIYFIQLKNIIMRVSFSSKRNLHQITLLSIQVHIPVFLCNQTLKYFFFAPDLQLPLRRKSTSGLLSFCDVISATTAFVRCEVQQVCWSSLQNLSSKLEFRKYHLRNNQNLLKSLNEFLPMPSVIIE